MSHPEHLSGNASTVFRAHPRFWGAERVILPAMYESQARWLVGRSMVDCRATQCSCK